MKNYVSYIENQAVSPNLHEKLLNLETVKPPRPQRKGMTYMKLGALAACAALLIGLGPKVLTPAPAVTPAPAASLAAEGDDEDFWSQGPGGTADPIATEPTLDNYVGDGDHAGFTAAGPADGSKLMFPMIAWVDYADVTDDPEIAGSLAYNPGSFAQPLDKGDIQKLFWGPGGKPAVENPKADPGDFPLILMNWAGYIISGEAVYDGSGDLWELRVWGTKGEDSFTLRAAPGHIPPTCIVESGAVTTDVLGTEVSGWYRSYDRDGDDAVEHICTSEFIANGVGFRFENVGSGGMKAGTDEADGLGGAKLFNQMVVTQLCHADGFYLDQFACTEDIPAWAEENYDTVSQAVAGAEQFALGHPEADFLSYLPTEGPKGYGDFHARLSYQEGVRKTFYVRWTHGYDDVEVDVHLPEGDEIFPDPVDVAVPESYDWRLYDGAICDVVPEEYRDNFYKPAFRAGDMSLETVKARMRDKDTGGQSCNFWVLHDNGTAVSYSCSGVSAEYVWSLVEATL